MKHAVSIVLLAAIAGLALPAVAQQAGTGCEDRFKAADLNNDGVLTGSEIGNAMASMPRALASKSRITRAEYVSECSKGAR
jgi:hypothetical protein